MDEVFAMITLSQTILDEVAGAAERLAGILSWEEPRVTAGFVVLLLALAWSLIYVEMVTRFFVKVILGVVLKTVFTVVSPSAIKFGVSAAILFVMRHPAILPDEKTKAVQEAKARAAREAALAKELAEAEGDADDESRAAARAGAAFETVAAAQRLLPHAHAERQAPLRFSETEDEREETKDEREEMGDERETNERRRSDTQEVTKSLCGEPSKRMTTFTTTFYDDFLFENDF